MTEYPVNLIYILVFFFQSAYILCYPRRRERTLHHLGDLAMP